MLCSWPSFFAAYFLVLLFFGSGSAIGRNETDQLALLEFKAKITSDPFRILSTWNESIHFCKWSGVICGRRHQRVIVLDLDGQGFAGSISSHVGNLSFLREIWLRNNTLSGKIPPELGHLRRLQILSLRNNSITGEIPANLSSCSRLTVLEFYANRLEGKLPEELGSLSNLKLLSLEKNNLSGVIPSTFGNLSSLQIFAAKQNKISGDLPGLLGRLTNLQALALADNRLAGMIPSSIFNLSSLQVLDVGMNKLHGNLPSSLGLTLPNLQFLGASANFFTGSIPFSLSNASQLQIVGIAGNRLTGKVPQLEKLNDLQKLSFSGNYLGTGEADDLSFLSSLTNATNLYILALQVNRFGGVLPKSISNFSTVFAQLILSRNEIFGNIPTWIGNLASLVQIELSYNRFTGDIPEDIGKLQQLQLLSLSYNNFSGRIPLSLGNLTMLTQLNLAKNKLYGNIPSDLGKCIRLAALGLYQNNLHGTIPREVTSLTSLLYLSVSYNDLTGSLPVELGNLKNLEVLLVSENRLSGGIPSTLSRCVKLESLYMEGNNFQGIIPSSLSYLRGMEELDLSCNNFSGEIPDFLGDFVYLRSLNLSSNDFSGEVPKSGIFKNVTAFSIERNNKLCGGIAELHLRACNSKGTKSKGSTLALKLIIPLAFSLVGLLSMVCYLCHCCYRKRTNLPSFRIFGNTFQTISYKDLVKATNGFSTANLIGVGGFGSVYKGILDEGEKVIAVKVLNLEVRGASKSFIAECKALKSIKHRNLVKVLTACSSIDYQGNDFKALVYEFMANGSLEEWLHPNENEDETNEDSRHLSILQTLDIAIDVASVLDYLHNHCPESIVHCDLKPSNVLLDNDMNGHVGDFGLARFLSDASYDSSTNQSSSIGIRGSVGYIAPEYGLGNGVSEYGDVYSYGTLLLEMFTGKRPTNNMFSDNLCLHNFVKLALPEHVARIIDPRLLQKLNSASSGNIMECLISILEVGVACSEESPTDRIAISNVVAQLDVIRKTHFGSR